MDIYATWRESLVREEERRNIRISKNEFKDSLLSPREKSLRDDFVQLSIQTSSGVEDDGSSSDYSQSTVRRRPKKAPLPPTVMFDSEETRIDTTKESTTININFDDPNSTDTSFKMNGHNKVKKAKSNLTKKLFLEAILEKDESADVEYVYQNLEKFIEVFSFIKTTQYMFKKNSKIKYGKESDLEAINFIMLFLTVWGLAIITNLYLLAVPLYNVWWFLPMVDNYLVIAALSGH